MEFIKGVNTYMDLEEADSIVDDIYFEDDDEYKMWQSLDDKSKQRIILKATRLLDNLTWLGNAYPGYNTLRWPRLIQFEIIDCPYDVKAAILKQGLKEKKNSMTDYHKLQESGVKTYSVKNASISFTDNTGKNKLSNGVYGDIYSEYLRKWTY